MQDTPLAVLAQVGEVREGEMRGGKSGCSGPRQLNLPTTPEGEAGGRGWGSGAMSTLARCDPFTPRGGGWGGAGPGAPYFPYYPGPQVEGWGRSEGSELR